MNNEEKELYHHGILGMKWGIRRYQNPDGSLTKIGKKRYGIIEKEESKAEKASSKFMRNYHAKNAEEMKSEMKVADNFYKAKGLFNKFEEGFKNGKKATLLEGKSKGYERVESNTKFGKARNSQKAANYKYMSEYYRKVASDTFGDRMVRKYVFDSDYIHTPYQRLSGRTTTRGKNLVDNILTGGLGGLILDVSYKLNNRD